MNALLRRRVDGLCIVPAGLDHSYLMAEVRLGMPVLFLDRPPIHVQADTILLDNRGGAYKATQHLLSYGHRRIAMIQGDPQVYTGAERLQGYKEGAIKMVGFDTASTEIQLLQKNVVQALIGQKPYDMGIQAVQQALLAVQGKTTQKVVSTGSVTVTLDNMQDPTVSKYIYKLQC